MLRNDAMDELLAVPVILAGILIFKAVAYVEDKFFESESRRLNETALGKRKPLKKRTRG